MNKRNIQYNALDEGSVKKRIVIVETPAGEFHLLAQDRAELIAFRKLRQKYKRKMRAGKRKAVKNEW